jgi:hypothetical protein
MKFAFKISNKIKHHVKTRDKTADVYSIRGVYQTICKECLFRYIGQTERTFGIIYREHIREIKTNG